MISGELDEDKIHCINLKYFKVGAHLFNDNNAMMYSEAISGFTMFKLV